MSSKNDNANIEPKTCPETPLSTTEQLAEDWEIAPPWEVRECACVGLALGCEQCDGHGAFLFNTATGSTVSPMMADAMDRHG